ncbi:MAG: hypothetical protein KGR47_13390 [Acidobacteria bacterium]|nr:hypothetical protein [Acidobacteriota bacterium]
MRLRLLPLAALVALGVAACSSDSGTTVVVSHGPVPKPTYVDNGDEGPSPGDERIWNFSGSSDGKDVVLDFIMTTTAIDTPEKGVETRVTLGVFSFGGSDTLLLEGVGLYPGEGATLKPSATLERAIVGGTGKYAGATGSVVSEHLPDDTWTHTFRIDD